MTSAKSAELGVFEAMYTMRAMRSLKPDPVPLQMIHKILDAGIRAPNGQNAQCWAFLVVTGSEGKAFFGKRYDYWLKKLFSAALENPDTSTSQGRKIKAAAHLAKHMH